MPFSGRYVSRFVYRRTRKKLTICPPSRVAIALGEVYPNAQLQVLFGVKWRPGRGKGLNMYVTTQPDVLQGAAGTLSGIGDAMVARNSAAAAPTTGLAPAASDLVSAMTAAQFGQHGATYQQIAAQAAEVHEQLVAALRSGAGAYALTEAANAAAGSIGL